MIEAVDMEQVESKSQLPDVLRGSRLILLGTEIDAPREFFAIEVRFGSDLQRVGILSAGIGVKPGWVIRHDKLFVGFNSRIAILRSNNSLELFAEIPLLTLFWQFLDVPNADTILVLGETAVVALTSSGDQLWRIDTDLITDFELSDTMLRLEFGSDPPMSLDLASGIAS